MVTPQLLIHLNMDHILATAMFPPAIIISIRVLAMLIINCKVVIIHRRVPVLLFLEFRDMEVSPRKLGQYQRTSLASLKRIRKLTWLKISFIF